jgi:FkbM family methyltransferase
MIGTAFWSWAYGMATREQNNLPASLAGKLLRIFARIERSIKGDPIVKVRVGDRNLLVPWSHHLPMLLRHCPFYESEIGRLAKHLCRIEGELRMIDVGANVGDTIAILPPLDQAKFLCVEGSEKYYDLLQKNYGSDSRVELLFALLTDGNPQSDSIRIQEVEGTAHVAVSASPSAAVPRLTLDSLLEKSPEFRNANFVKIDTDGYDLKVLRGATEFLKRAKPCLHIEFAPTYWREYGKCDLADAQTFLSDFGYKEVLVYDNMGYFVGRDRADNPAFLRVLWDYAMRIPSRLYLNVIAFHSSRRDLEQFYDAEASGAAAEH